MKNYLFPHISRIFTACIDSSTFRYGVFALCMAIIATNAWLHTIAPKDTVTARINLLSSPFAVERHIQLGEQLYGVGNEKEASREIAVAEQLYMEQQKLSNPPSSVLGAQSTQVNIQGTWEREQNRRNQLYSFWVRIIEVKPDYRDAYVTLATLAHVLGKNEDAKRYIHQAYVLDPNDQYIQQLKGNLENTN